MSGLQKQSPNIKSFLEGALPKEKSDHVLALGELHSSGGHIDFLHAHLAELKTEHNVGVIGLELPAYMEVPFWAYRDGVLPVSPDTALSYMEMLHQLAIDAQYDKNGDVRLMLEALDQQISPICFDARKPVREFIKKQSVFSQYPEIAQRLRQNPDSINDIVSIVREYSPAFIAKSEKKFFFLPEARRSEAVVPMVRIEFLKHEIGCLLEQNPDYQRCYDNILAVINAGERFYSRIDKDAMSAALFTARLPQNANAITISGAMHVSSIAPMAADFNAFIYRTRPTFDRHLASNLRGLKVTTALVAADHHARETLAAWIGNYRFAKRLAASGRGEMPNCLFPDTDGALRPEDMDPGSVESVVARLGETRRHYEHICPDPVVSGAKEVARIAGVERKISRNQKLQSALAKVQNDSEHRRDAISR